MGNGEEGMYYIRQGALVALATGRWTKSRHIGNSRAVFLHQPMILAYRRGCEWPTENPWSS